MEKKSINVLVTGATGFLGSYLCDRLNKEGYNVYGVGRNILRGKNLQSKGINFRQVSLENLEEITKACQSMDYIFHCAAKSSSWGKYEEFYQSNVIGTKNVIKACFMHKIKKLIYVSSPSIYFEFKDKLDIKETDELPQKQVNYYALTKKMAEDEIDKAYNQGLSVITIRPRAIFGIGDTALLPRLIRANREKFIPITALHDILVDITHVENVVEALICALNAPSCCSGKKYNITNGEHIYLYKFLEELLYKMNQPFKSRKIPYKLALYVAEVMELISKYFKHNKEPALTKYSVGLLSFSMTLDITEARKDIGYEPVKTMAEGINELVRYNEEKHEYC